MATVGVGVIIQNKEGKILVGKRKSALAPYYSISGGRLEEGETFEKCAIREILEETGMELKAIKVIGITNNLDTYIKFNMHTVSIVLFSDKFVGSPKNLEPEKCEMWIWADPKKLPEPHTDFSMMSVNNWLKDRFYQEYF